MFSTGSQAAGSIASAIPDLPGGAVDCMSASFGYLKSLGLEVWNEAGLRLQSVEQPGVMTLSSNALANLHVFLGTACTDTCVPPGFLFYACSAMFQQHALPGL